MESWASPAPYVPSSPFPRLVGELLFCLPRFQVAQGVSEKKRDIYTSLSEITDRSNEGMGQLDPVLVWKITSGYSFPKKYWDPENSVRGVLTTPFLLLKCPDVLPNAFFLSLYTAIRPHGHSRQVDLRMHTRLNMHMVTNP